MCKQQRIQLRAATADSKAVITINAHEEFSISQAGFDDRKAKQARSSNLAESKHGSAVIIINSVKLRGSLEA